MGEIKRILLLAGSAEARQIAVALTAMGVFVRALMSEPPRGPNPMPVPFEVRAVTCASDIADALADVDAVLDASHGFDGGLTMFGHAAAQIAKIPFVTMSRPGWDVSEDPKWRSARDVASAMALIRPGARVFSATGWASLPDYADFPGDCLMLRQTSPHERAPPFDFVSLEFGTAPFTLTQEIALFKERHVDTLICRNLGGLPSRPKLDAAKSLGLDVILIDRPPLPTGVQVVTTVEDAASWVAAQ